MKLIKIILFLVLAASIYSDICHDTLLQENCEFYTKCIEPINNCGQKGYPLGYGYRYCSKFTQLIDEFPPAGKLWVDWTRQCLKKALVNFTTKSNDPKNCAKLYKSAFDSHPNCYVQAGFCKLLVQSDVLQSLTALFKVLEFKDLASLSSIKQMVLTAKSCGAEAFAVMTKFIGGIYGSGSSKIYLSLKHFMKKLKLKK